MPAEKGKTEVRVESDSYGPQLVAGLVAVGVLIGRNAPLAVQLVVCLICVTVVVWPLLVMLAPRLRKGFDYVWSRAWSN